MRRKDSSDPTSDAAFESHMSTITKLGLGMLILITMASTFSNQLTLSQPVFKPPEPEKKKEEPPPKPAPQPSVRQLGWPLMTSAAPGAKGAYFECRNGRIYEIDFEVVNAPFEDLMEMVKSGDAGLEEKLAAYDARQLSNKYYSFEFKFKSGTRTHPEIPGIIFHPRKGVLGETPGEALAAEGLFRKRVGKLEKSRDYVWIKVWPDSFAALRELRAWLKGNDYKISWDPDEDPIVVHLAEFRGGRATIE